MQEYLTTKAIELILDAAKRRVQSLEAGTTVKTAAADLEKAITNHLDHVRRWSSEIAFADLLRPKHTTDVFIPLEAFVTPSRLRFAHEAQPLTRPLLDVIRDSDRHLIVLGPPGAGKTTTLKYLATRLLLAGDLLPEVSFPLVVNLEELNHRSVAEGDSGESLLVGYLCELLQLSVALPSWLRDQTGSEQRRQSLLFNALVTTLSEWKPLVMLDGLDEVEPTRRAEVIRSVSQLTTRLDGVKVLLTSRTGEFRYAVPHSDLYEIAPLSDDRIRSFAVKWLGSAAKAHEFVTKVRASPYADTAIRPLTLAHLCAVYERTSDVPTKPRTVYRKVINLLLEEWDQQRGVKRVSRYADFEADRKAELLSHLAYELTVTLRLTRFSEVQMSQAFRAICHEYGFNRNESLGVISEIETHSGLIVQTGYEEFAFAHKSIQEFLTAECLVRLPSLPGRKVLQKIPNEAAIAVAMSASPSEYISALLKERAMWQSGTPGWVSTFATRLLLEAPELVGNRRVGEALVLLFSTYIAEWTDPERNLNGDQTYIGLLQLTSRLVKRESLSIMRWGYEPDDSWNGSVDVVRLRRSRASEGRDEQQEESFAAREGPGAVYLPKALWHLWEKPT